MSEDADRMKNLLIAIQNKNPDFSLSDAYGVYFKMIKHMSIEEIEDEVFGDNEKNE